MSTIDLDFSARDYEGGDIETTEAIEPRNATPPLEISRKFSEGLELMNHGEPAAAARCFEQIVHSLPDFADAHVGLGIAYAVIGKVYLALDHLEKAASLQPSNFFAHFKLGQLQFKLHVPKKGYEEMQRARDCATSVEERRLVGQLIHEQKKLEQKGLARPTWNRPFSRNTLLLLGASVLIPIIYMFIVSIR